jgi:chitinase
MSSLPLFMLLSQMPRSRPYTLASLRNEPGQPPEQLPGRLPGQSCGQPSGQPSGPSFGQPSGPSSGDLSGKVFCGFWFGWNPQVSLTSIPPEYNLICVAFVEPNAEGVLTFAPYMDEDEFIAGMESLKAEGRAVLLSLGGAHEGIILRESDKPLFKDELMRLIERYGFNGIDIDLEGASISAGDNQSVVPAVIREIKDFYRSQGKPFIVTMAPEFNLLRGYAAPYKPFLQDLEGYYDLIFPQYYNQGADGIWSDEYHMFLSQNDNEHKAEFLYTLTNAIVTGTNDFLQIHADKFVIGLPASPLSAINGYVENPDDVRWALDRLEAEGHGIRGLMTWSINQDSVNGYEFVQRYAPMIFNA